MKTSTNNEFGSGQVLNAKQSCQEEYKPKQSLQKLISIIFDCIEGNVSHKLVTHFSHHHN